MTARRRPSNMAGAARGFTLLEILISAFIIALGVLGLTALFAGTARQQQVSAELSESVTTGQNASAIVSAKMGRLDADDVSNPNDFGNYKQAGALLTQPCSGDPLYFDVWYPVPAIAQADGVGASLSVNPDSADDGLYFLVEETLPVIAYKRDPTVPTVGAALSVGSANNEAFNSSLINDADTIPLPSPYNLSAPDGFIPLRHNRIDARSVEIRIRYARVSVVNGITIDTPNALNDPPDGLAHTGPPFEAEYRWTPYRQPFNEHGGSTTAYVPNFNYWSNPGRYAVFFRNGVYDPNPDTADYIVLDLENNDLDSEAFARIASMSLGPLRQNDGQEFDLMVDQIRIQRYSWRSDELVSANDRVYETNDPTFGRRADAGYSLLFSRSTNGLTRVAVFTYTVEPLGRTGTFIPPETCNDVAFMGETGVLREIEVTLGWDDTRELYHVTVDEDDASGNSLEWAVQTGSILLFKGEESADPLDSKGADLGVRVIRRERLTNGNWRGFLDDAPRAAGGALLRDLGNTLNTTAWVIQDTVTTAAPNDNSAWRLRPVEVRVFPVSSNK